MSDEERDSVAAELAALDRRVGMAMRKLIVGLITSAIIGGTGLILTGARWQASTDDQLAQHSREIARVEQAQERAEHDDIPALRQQLQAITVQLARTTTQLAATENELGQVRSMLERQRRRRR